MDSNPLPLENHACTKRESKIVEFHYCGIIEDVPKESVSTHKSPVIVKPKSKIDNFYDCKTLEDALEECVPIPKSPIIRKPKLKIVNFSCGTLKDKPQRNGSTRKSPIIRRSKLKIINFHGSRPLEDIPEDSTNHWDEVSVDELAAYFENFVHIPRKMSAMAEMMYT